MTEQDSLHTLLEKHHTEAWRWARQCCRYQTEWAEEVLQTAYVKVLEGATQPRDWAAFKPWLFGVIRFTALEWWRKQRVYEPLEHALAVVHPEPEPDDPVYYEQIIKELPERQAEVLLLVFYHQLTLEQAAEVMEIAPGTASTHYARGKQQLAERLRKRDSVNSDAL